MKLDGSIEFIIWIKQFVKESSDKGLFARWLEDSDFQNYRKISSNLSFKTYMIKNDCSIFLIELFDECWDEFVLLPNSINQPCHRLLMKEVMARYKRF